MTTACKYCCFCADQHQVRYTERKGGAFVGLMGKKRELLGDYASQSESKYSPITIWKGCQ